MQSTIYKIDKQHKVLLWSRGANLQHLVINHNGQEYEKGCVYTYNRITLPYSGN